MTTTRGTANGSNPRQPKIYGRENINYQGPQKAAESTEPDRNAGGDFAVDESQTVDFSSLKGKDRVEAMKTELLDGMNRIITDKEAFKDYIDFLRDAYTYSFNNQLLIQIQKPGAVNCKTYNQWSALGYQVKKGSKSASVLRPMMISEVVTDSNGNPVMGPDGNPKKNQKLVGYSAYSVFSVQDLDPEVKEPPLGIGEMISNRVESYRKNENISDNEVMRRDLESVAQNMGVTVTYQSSAEDSALNDTTGGYAVNRYGAKHIVINTDFKDHSQTYTLAHELGHVMCGHIEEDSLRTSANAPDREVEAESVAYSISRAYGLDHGDRAYAYLVSWCAGDESKIGKAMSNVAKASGVYYSTLEKILTGISAQEQNAAANASNTEKRAERPAKKKPAKKTARTRASV